MKKKDTTILLVDDELDILEIIGYNLTAEGYNVVTAQNGVEAIKKAKKHKPQVSIAYLRSECDWALYLFRYDASA